MNYEIRIKEKMNYSIILWVNLLVYAINTFEEGFFYTRKKRTFDLENVATLFISNSSLFIVGFCCAEIQWHYPIIGLMFPSYQFSNATNKIITSIIDKKFIPGLITSISLSIPASIWTFFGAFKDKILTYEITLGAIILGLILNFFNQILSTIQTSFKKIN